MVDGPVTEPLLNLWSFLMPEIISQEFKQTILPITMKFMLLAVFRLQVDMEETGHLQMHHLLFPKIMMTSTPVSFTLPDLDLNSNLPGNEIGTTETGVLKKALLLRADQ